MSSPEQRLDALRRGEFSDESFGVEALKDISMLALLAEENTFDRLKLARNFIHAVLNCDKDAVDGYLGIKIVDKAENRPVNEDCFGYLFGTDTDSETLLSSLFNNSDVSQTPITGAYALYMDEEMKPQHIGLVMENARIQSKWGLYSNVYEHEPLLVPLSYGWQIAYLNPHKSFRKAEQVD